jgi:hypothetical protein
VGPSPWPPIVSAGARDPSAIIIVNPDHGARYSATQLTLLADLGPAEIRERLGILNALRLPEACRGALNPRLTPLNVMRLVFACLGDHEPRFTKPRFFVDPPIASPEYGTMLPVSVFDPPDSPGGPGQ